MSTRVSAVLQEKGREVLTARAEDTVHAVAQLLSARRIGAVPVLDDSGRLIGILSERDIVRSVSQYGAHALTLPVSELMTREVKTCTADDAIVELMQVMTEHRLRHLPVMRNGKLDGIISIGDVVKQRLAEAQSEVDALREYIAS